MSTMTLDWTAVKRPNEMRASAALLQASCAVPEMNVKNRRVSAERTADC
jgi:hypothetical protein